MRVQRPGGPLIDLGTTETTPTIGIVDYSRRVTDDFGVTTVVKRGFARRMSVRVALPFDGVDDVQAQLADLRATSALWTADDRFAWLQVEGFYKDFELDLAVPPTSFCRLTVEGLAETELLADPGGDPAPVGQASTLRLVQPSEGDLLVSSSVPENDYLPWAAATTYAFRARVIKTATHRIYESVTDGNVGHDPETAFDQWIDVGPTNRWAMFDQSLGTVTAANDSIVVQVTQATAVALLDVVASTVRVQATGYDETKIAANGAVTFLDLPAASGTISVTVSGSGPISVGTLVSGSIAQLGMTEASPTAGINDYSRKVVDDFGEVTVVQRAWAKRMTAKALIRTDEIDHVANRIASVRARPCLWIGDVGSDSLTIYGFFKEFSIEVGESVSKLSLSIEGLSKAAPIVPAQVVDWDDTFRPAYWSLRPGTTRVSVPESRSGWGIAIDAGAQTISMGGTGRIRATPGKPLFARLQARAADRVQLIDADGARFTDSDGAFLIDAPRPPNWPLTVRIVWESTTGEQLGDVEVGRLTTGTGSIQGSAVAPEGSSFARLSVGGAPGTATGRWTAWEPWIEEYQPSADVTSDVAPSIAGPPPLVLSADYTGAITSPLPIPVAFRRSRGPIDVTSSAVWGAVFPPGVTGTIDNTPGGTSRGIVTITGVTNGGPIRVVSELDGVVLDAVLPVTVNISMPPSSAPASPGEPASMSVTTPIYNSTFAPVGTDLSFIAAADGTADFSANLSYQVRTGSARMAAKWSLSADDGATWSDVDVEVIAETEAATVTDPEPPGGLPWYRQVDDFRRYEEQYPGYINVAQTETGLTPGAAYKARLLGRRESGDSETIYPSGVASVTP